jgi:hypothetical protein
MFMTGADPDEVWPLVRDFHYSRRMPSNVHHCFAWRALGGLFGDRGEPLAAAIYGQPVNRAWPTDSLELQRLVRRDDFGGRLSEFLSWTIRWLRANTSTPFILSYADSGKGHHGGIYQATGWTYVMDSKPRQDGIRNKDTGEYIHGRQVGRMFGSQKRDVVSEAIPNTWELAYHETKYLYVKPLRQQLSPLLKRFGWQPLSYPKPNATCPVDAPVPTGASAVQPREVAPTHKESRTCAE